MAAAEDTPATRWSKIATAIRDNNEALLDTLLVDLPHGFPINGFGGGKTLIHYAAIYCGARVVQRLIALGADVNMETNSDRDDYDPENSFPIMIAINRGDPEMVGLLVRNRCDLTVRNGNGLTPLLQAAQRGDVILLSIIASRLTTMHDRNPENPDTLDQIEPVLGMNALDILCDIAVSHITSEPPEDVPRGILECAVYLMVEYKEADYRLGFPVYGNFPAPEIRRMENARTAAIERSDRAAAAVAAVANDWHARVHAQAAAAEALAAIPPEPVPPVARMRAKIEDFGMDIASFKEVYEGLKRMGFADDAVRRRRHAALAYARRAEGGRRRKTQGRRVKRRVKGRTLRRLRRRV